MYKTRTITKDLKSVPFDVAYQLCEDAQDIAVSTAKASVHSARPDDWEGSVRRSLVDEAEIKTKARQIVLGEEFIPRYKLESILADSVMPQIMQYLTRNVNSQWLKEATVEGQISPKKVLNKIFDFNNSWDRGLYYFLMLDSRSCYLKQQYKGSAKQYCALVPLIMYPFKLNHSISYNSWSRDGLNLIVNPSLYKAMTCEVPELTTEELLEIREEGLMIKSGAKAGEMRDSKTTYKLYGSLGKLHDLPNLAVSMLTQTWCAHPSNRSKYMILDPRDWDSVPAPLVTNNLFVPTVQTTADVDSIKEELPWS